MGRNELITLHIGVQGLAYEMHAVSGKFSSPKKPSATKMGWKQWGAKAASIGSKLLKLKKTIDNEPDDNGNEVPTVFEKVLAKL